MTTEVAARGFRIEMRPMIECFTPPVQSSPVGCVQGMLHLGKYFIINACRYTIDAACLLPDHIHCVWVLTEEDANYAMRWKETKCPDWIG